MNLKHYQEKVLKGTQRLFEALADAKKESPIIGGPLTSEANVSE